MIKKWIIGGSFLALCGGWYGYVKWNWIILTSLPLKPLANQSAYVFNNPESDYQLTYVSGVWLNTGYFKVKELSGWSYKTTCGNDCYDFYAVSDKGYVYDLSLIEKANQIDTFRLNAKYKVQVDHRKNDIESVIIMPNGNLLLGIERHHELREVLLNKTNGVTTTVAVYKPTYLPQEANKSYEAIGAAGNVFFSFAEVTDLFYSLNQSKTFVNVLTTNNQQIQSEKIIHLLVTGLGYVTEAVMIPKGTMFKEDTLLLLTRSQPLNNDTFYINSVTVRELVEAKHKSVVATQLIARFSHHESFFDNFEGMAYRYDPIDKRSYLYLLTDNNDSWYAKTLIMKFALEHNGNNS